MTELGTGLDLEQLAVTTARTLPEEYWHNRWGPVFRALMGILAEGRAASVEELVAASDTPASQVRAGLPRDAERDEQGRVIGFGITLEPTPHRVEIDGHTVYAWCAGDTLGNLPATGRRVRISSTCPATGAAITLVAGPDGVSGLNPPDAVVSVPLTGDPRDIRGSLCQRSSFFVSAEAASEWLAHTPDGTLLSVADAHRWALRTSQLIMRERAPA